MDIVNAAELCTHCGTSLNNDFGINNERQDCEIGTVCVWILVGRGEVNGSDEGKGI
jgi:hypothetical protein